jgi:serine/threonine protein kinase
MPLDPGTHLGPYEITALLGAGGMGEVYRAKDTRLERTVAIKILPASISADPVAKQRFEREAKTISGLNHPNIYAACTRTFPPKRTLALLEAILGRVQTLHAVAKGESRHFRRG